MRLSQPTQRIIFVLFTLATFCFLPVISVLPDSSSSPSPQTTKDVEELGTSYRFSYISATIKMDDYLENKVSLEVLLVLEIFEGALDNFKTTIFDTRFGTPVPETLQLYHNETELDRTISIVEEHLIVDAEKLNMSTGEHMLQYSIEVLDMACLHPDGGQALPGGFMGYILNDPTDLISDIIFQFPQDSEESLLEISPSPKLLLQKDATTLHLQYDPQDLGINKDKRSSTNMFLFLSAQPFDSNVVMNECYVRKRSYVVAIIVACIPFYGCVFFGLLSIYEAIKRKLMKKETNDSDDKHLISEKAVFAKDASKNQNEGAVEIAIKLPLEEDSGAVSL